MYFVIFIIWLHLVNLHEQFHHGKINIWNSLSSLAMWIIFFITLIYWICGSFFLCGPSLAFHCMCRWISLPLSFASFLFFCDFFFLVFCQLLSFLVQFWIQDYLCIPQNWYCSCNSHLQPYCIDHCFFCFFHCIVYK